MKIRILQQLNDIESATGIAVIIDVFRAFTVEPYLISGGTKYLYATEKVEDAFAYKDMNPETVLIGERGGKIVDGFDFGNSPEDVSNACFTDGTVVHTTSAGTKGVARAINASEILVSSLVNSKATAEYILAKNPREVALVCMGLDAKEETEEDTLCARYIKSLLHKELGLEYESINWDKEIEILKNTSGAKFFNPALKDIFKTEDFYRCIEIDKFDFALKANKESDNFWRITKC